MTTVSTEAETDTVNLPPGPRWPKFVQGVAFVVARKRMVHVLRRRFGTAVTINIPFFGRGVLVSDPVLVKELFMTSTDIVGQAEPNLGEILGPGSMFSLDGDEHRRRRKLLVPPFHGKRMKAYESIIIEEVRRETASWPDGVEFATLPSFARITVNAILRAVFGVAGDELAELRDLLLGFVELGSRLATMPFLQRDLGRHSPGGRFLVARARYDALVGSLIDKALADRNLDQRDDVLAMMLQARYDDGEPMSRGHIADELLTLLVAGHETTATTLAWAVERLRRHPDLLRRLTAEVDDGGSELCQATVYEVQRSRPVIDATARRVIAPTARLGQWVIPKNYNVIVGIGLVHSDDRVFPDAATFDPDRFLGTSPDNYSWVPFGGGTRRCIGAAFANMEMNVALQSLLRDFELVPAADKAERWHSRGVAYAPAKGGLAVVRRRPAHDQTRRDIDQTTGATDAAISA